MLVRSENRWLYRVVTRHTKNCSVWSAFELVLPLWWWLTHLSRDNSVGSATAGIRAASVHQRCWNIKNRFPYKVDQQGIFETNVVFRNSLLFQFYTENVFFKVPTPLMYACSSDTSCGRTTWIIPAQVRRPSPERQHRLKRTSNGTILGLSGNVPIQPPVLGSNKHTPHEGESRDITTTSFTSQA